jgi:hypothetical protein
MTMNLMRTIGLFVALFLATGCGGSGEPESCEGVVCDQPPDDTCLDANTLLAYRSTGVCNPETGKCIYQADQRNCPEGCADGRCQGGPLAEGFVSVFEHRGGMADYGEVRAYFAEELLLRKAPFYFDADHMSETAAEGDCVLLKNWLRFLDMCDPPCGGDQYCDGQTCVDYPTHYDAGTLNFGGLTIALDLEPDDYDNYQAETPPADLFAPGASVSASALGSELEGFRLAATGVSPLETGSDTVDLIAGQPTTITWTPADDGARVQVFLRTGIHRPTAPSAALFCDVPDSQGEVVISASLVDAFRNEVGINQQPCEIMRYTEDRQTPFEGEIVLRVASVQSVMLNTP